MSQPTCGDGLAEHSVLPGKMGELVAAMAENLELHMKALDVTDENSKKEYDAYLQLAGEHRKIATQLQAIAKQMSAYRDLPMGRHDYKTMSAPEVRESFKKFVKLEQALLALLQSRVEQDQRMLTEMGGAGSGTS
jgi:hypothetical protein